MDVYKSLDQIRKTHFKYGLICDEFGSLQGIITMKDILEALAGSLPGETEDPAILPRKDGGWLIDGQCSFYDFLGPSCNSWDISRKQAKHSNGTDSIWR